MITTLIIWWVLGIIFSLYTAHKEKWVPVQMDRWQTAIIAFIFGGFFMTLYIASPLLDYCTRKYRFWVVVLLLMILIFTPVILITVVFIKHFIRF